jgi:multisubunit Na+/H+ antiporter MnhF subunit
MTDSIHTLCRAVLALTAFLVLLRAWRGPSVFDRAIAFETLALVVVGSLLLLANLHVDAAMGLALFSFIGTALLGHFLGQGEFPHE